MDNLKDTTLMAYFKAVNIENNLHILPNDGRPLAQALTYVQFCKSLDIPKKYMDKKKAKRKSNWKIVFCFPKCWRQILLKNATLSG